jgi:murein L,D-transpeptidase YafK
MIPDWFLRVFVAKNPIYFILVEKDKQRLRLLRYEDKLKVVAEYPCATGEKEGKKRFSGDSRTPEGIYFITKIYTDNKVTIFGKRAFHLDFPNIFDKNSGINGDGIYIHGTNRSLEPMSTKGCITLKNRDLDKLVRFLEPDTTPVMIIPGFSALKGQTTERDESEVDLAKTLLASVEIRRDQVEFEYLYRLTDGIQNVAVGEFTLYQNEYPRSQGYSRSYLAFNREKGWTAKERICRATPLQPGQLLPRYPKDKQKIIEFIETWRKAWESKDIETYVGCYNTSFRYGHDGRMDLAAYRAYKDGLTKKYKFIKVDISGVSVLWTGNGAKVSFHQVYRSDQYRAEGRKTLRLIFKEQRWGIERESWSHAQGDKEVKR